MREERREKKEERREKSEERREKREEARDKKEERKNLSARLSSSISRATSICASLSNNIVAYREEKRKNNRQIQKITDIGKKRNRSVQKK
jgi:hypothetical protein